MIRPMKPPGRTPVGGDSAEDYEEEGFHDPFAPDEDFDEDFDEGYDEDDEDYDEDDEDYGDLDEDDFEDTVSSPSDALYASDGEDRHHMLPWYREHVVKEVRARKGSHVVEKYPPDFTEDDIVRHLLEQGHEGKFSIFGIGPDGRYLPDSAEINVRPKTKITSFLDGSSHVRRGATGGGGSSSMDASVLLDHEASRQRELDVFRREEAARHEAMLREQREADERRLRERQDEMDRLRERQLELERQAAAEAKELAEARAEEARASAEIRVREQEKRAEEARLAAERAVAEEQRRAESIATMQQQSARSQIESMQQMTQQTLQQMQMMFQQKADATEMMAARQEQTLTGAFSSQIAMLQSEVDHWKRRSEDLERRYHDRDEEARRREEDLRERTDREINKAKEYAEEKVRDIEREYRRREEDLVARLNHREQYLTEQKETLRQEVDNLREQARHYEMKMLEMGFKVKEATTGGPSKRASEIREIASVAKDVGVDPAAVFRNELGYGDAEKRSTFDGLVESMLPMLAGAFTSQGSGGTTQGPALPAAIPANSGSTPSASPSGAAGALGQTEKL